MTGTTPLLKLTNGVQMPALGLGVYQSPRKRPPPRSRPHCATATA